MDFTEVSADMSGLEQGKIKAYIQKHHTAMLTVMFTDIEGYTELTERQGDSYVAKLRQYHDELLKTIIEENDSGLVVKFIGDAVMAVFSEPSVGVKRAIDIQVALEQFNKDHTEFEDIAVRIGLHVGQIAVEDDVQMDIFGRHVNRAARVESLAAGGQVLVTYPVWDSAKGWLDSSDEIDCVAHGSYLLKGIPEPIEIFEVYLPSHKKPSAPVKGRVKSRSGVMKWLNIAAVALLILYLVLVNLKGDSLLINTSVGQDLFLNGELLSLGDVNEEGFRVVENDLTRGASQLSYQVSSQLAYVSDFEIEKGQTLVMPEFKELALPSLKLRNDAARNAESKSRAFEFESIQSGVFKGEWSIAIDSTLGESSNVSHNVQWEVVVSEPESIIYQGSEVLSHTLEEGMNAFDPIELEGVDGLKITLSGFMANKIIDATLNWEFSD
jgi:class 3 adenylate cyclase